MELIIQRIQTGSTKTLKLKGILDISTSSIIEPYLEELDSIERLIFDFSELEFIDSTGIGSIMNAIYLSKEKNFKLAFHGVDEMTHQVFETVGLYHILEEIHKEDI
ncbi:STAS domain-containing protein [Robertmurraya kyonggiensis]|uniref:STAS domain-containing protein n=1 Tax=Robertmurraya kyonggiensis TaxID=1037680 RepID=A0A4U1CZR5_9BACI|nr:STAS domain-containing protein [Robertmurraya kyonggiensis]TKC15351.1 STAS domain-containing protein [Robertmurraya kyonggiensis]